MKKKITLLIVLLLICSVILFFVFHERNEKVLETAVNNTINFIEDNDYKISINLDSIYTYDGISFKSKINYIERKNEDKYEFSYKLYESNNLTNENTSYALKNEDNYTYYYKENDEYKTKEVDDISKENEMNINIKTFFKKIDNFKKKNGNYIIKMNKNDVYGLIYNKEFNGLSGNTYVTLSIKDDFVKTISFDASMADNEKCKVKILIDFSSQEVKLP